MGWIEWKQSEANRKVAECGTSHRICWRPHRSSALAVLNHHFLASVVSRDALTGLSLYPSREHRRTGCTGRLNRSKPTARCAPRYSWQSRAPRYPRHAAPRGTPGRASTRVPFDAITHRTGLNQFQALSPTPGGLKRPPPGPPRGAAHRPLYPGKWPVGGSQQQ